MGRNRAGKNLRSEAEDVLGKLLSEYEELRDVLVELRVLPKPRSIETTVRLEPHADGIYELDVQHRYLVFHVDTWDIFLSVQRAIDRTDDTEARDVLLKEEFGEGRLEAVRRHDEVLRMLEADPDAEVIVLPKKSGRPLPPFVRRWPPGYLPPNRSFKKRPPMGEWFRLARKRAKELKVDPERVLQPLQGKRADSDELKRARLDIARYLRSKDATQAEVAQVFGISASAVSQMLSAAVGEGPSPTGKSRRRAAELKRAAEEARKVVANDIRQELEGGTDGN